jgi:hypothetical protein
VLHGDAESGPDGGAEFWESVKLSPARGTGIWVELSEMEVDRGKWEYFVDLDAAVQ